jgi:predicted HTH domain antitoxin
MTTVTVELEDELADYLQQLGRPVGRTLRELVVLDLYREGDLSADRAAQLLAMPLHEFIPYAGKLGIAFTRVTADELDAQVAALEAA